MTVGPRTSNLELTEEEAFSLLTLCLTSPTRLDTTSESAVRKLANYCTMTTGRGGQSRASSPAKSSDHS